MDRVAESLGRTIKIRKYKLELVTQEEYDQLKEKVKSWLKDKKMFSSEQGYTSMRLLMEYLANQEGKTIYLN